MQNREKVNTQQRFSFDKEAKKIAIQIIKEDISKQFSLQNSNADFSAVNIPADSKIITKKRPVNKRKFLKEENIFVTININSDHSIAFQRLGANKSPIDFTITSVDSSSKFYFQGMNAESYFTTQTLNAGKLKSQGLTEGMIITKVNNELIQTIEQLTNKLNQGSSVVWLEVISPTGEKLFVGFEI